MALFSHLDMEDKVQVNDKTRFDASKSYVTTGGSAITTMSLVPGVGATAINVFSATVANRFSDFQFTSQTFDIDSTNNKIDFNEGGLDLVATLTSASYSQSGLLTEIQTQLNSAGANTYTVSADQYNNITIAADGMFRLLPVSGTNWLLSYLPHLGFKFDTVMSNSHEGEIMDYGIKKISLTIGDGTTTQTVDRYLKLYTAYSDNLYSSDEELQKFEGDIGKWVKAGRNTHKNLLRKSQDLILDWIDSHGFVDIYGNKYTKWDLVDKADVREWSTMMTLKLIFENVSNATDDVFSVKAKKYESKEVIARNRFLRLDINKDGIVDQDEHLRIKFGNLFMR